MFVELSSKQSYVNTQYQGDRMKQGLYVPSLVDFAYEIIAIHEENEFLRSELEHYKKLHEQHCERLGQSLEHSKEMTGLIFKAALDPNSSINNRK
jgi:hypothetical protein